MLEEQLVKFGLSEKEAKIYLALLELGASTVNEISRHAEINRSSAYIVLESLEKRNLVSATQNEVVQRFKAAPPEKVLSLAEESLREQQDLTQTVRNIIPDLKSLNKDYKYHPTVKVYEGLDGLREVYYSILDVNADELLVYADGYRLSKLFPEFIEKNKERSEKGIPLRAINPYSKAGELLLRAKKFHNEQFILVPKEKFNFASDLAIYGNHVAFTSLDEEFGVLIESKPMAKAMRGHFELVWEGSKAFGKLLT